MEDLVGAWASKDPPGEARIDYRTGPIPAAHIMLSNDCRTAHPAVTSDGSRFVQRVHPLINRPERFEGTRRQRKMSRGDGRLAWVDAYQEAAVTMRYVFAVKSHGRYRR